MGFTCVNPRLRFEAETPFRPSPDDGRVWVCQGGNPLGKTSNANEYHVRFEKMFKRETFPLASPRFTLKL